MVYFASDVHLGLRKGNPSEREARFVDWLAGIPRVKGDSLVLLGDVWDFWYEYHDVIPKEGIRVVAQLLDMMDAGMQVYFAPGNHDIWCYHFFEEIGIHKLPDVSVVEFEGKRFMLAHGDRIGGSSPLYGAMMWVFHNRVLQALFSMLHPRIAYKFGTDWSKHNRYSHKHYQWKGEAEGLYKYAASRADEFDYFVCGHYHDPIHEQIPGGKDFFILDDWIEGGTPFASFDGVEFKVRA